MRFCVDFHCPVDEGTNHRKKANDGGEHQGSLPARRGIRPVRIEGKSRPSRRVVGADRCQTSDRQVNAKREAQLLAFEPARKSHRYSDDLRFRSQPKNRTSGHHDVEVALKSRQDCAHNAERRKQKQSLAQSKAVNENSANQERANRGQAVAGIQPSELRGGEIQLVCEDALQRIDTVVGVVIAGHCDTDHDQHNPAIRLTRFGKGIRDRLSDGH